MINMLFGALEAGFPDQPLTWAQIRILNLLQNSGIDYFKLLYGGIELQQGRYLIFFSGVHMEEAFPDDN